MQEQERFRESLNALMEIAKAKDNTLTMDEIKEVFQDISLEEEKFETIYAYLSSNKVKVQNYIGKDLSAFSKEIEETSPKKQDEKDEAYVKMYLEDISAIEPCKEEELEILLGKIKIGDKEAETRLIEGNLETVVLIVNDYRGRGIAVGDLIQEGNIGLMLAVPFMKDMEEPIKIREFVNKQIRTAIEETLGEQIFENQSENEIVIKMNRLSEAAKQLEEELGRHPIVSETAEFMKVSEEEVKRIMDLSKEIVAELHHNED